MGYLQQHLLAHTNGKLGFAAAHQEIEVVEVFRLTANIDVNPVLRGEVRKQPRLTANVHVQAED